MGPLAELYAILAQREMAARRPMPRANPYINPMLDDSPPLSDRTTFEATPRFRDPDQLGPAPPTSRPTLSQLYGAK